MLERSKSLQIYMKPGIKEDDLMLRVWEACRRHDRPQDVFRSMLRAGLMAMLESGEMPESVIEDCGLDAILERRRRRSRKASEQAPAPPPAYPPYGFHPQPSPSPPQQSWSPARHEPAQEAPGRAEAAAPPREAPPAAVPESPARKADDAKPAASGSPSGEGGNGKKGRIGNLM